MLFLWLSQSFDISGLRVLSYGCLTYREYFAMGAMSHVLLPSKGRPVAYSSEEKWVGGSCRSGCSWKFVGPLCTERQDVCHGLRSWYHDVNTFNTDSICFKMLGYIRIYLWFGQTMTSGNSCHQGSHQCTVWGKSSWVLQGQGNGVEMLNLAWFFMRWFFVACANWGHTLEEPGKGDSVAALVFVSAVAPSSVGILHSKMIPKCNMYLRCNNVGKIIPAYWCVVYRMICMILYSMLWRVPGNAISGPSV